jgi:hypothetical protein
MRRANARHLRSTAAIALPVGSSMNLMKLEAQTRRAWRSDGPDAFTVLSPRGETGQPGERHSPHSSDVTRVAARELPLPRHTPAAEWTTVTSWFPGSRLDVHCITFPAPVSPAPVVFDANTPLTVAGAARASHPVPNQSLSGHSLRGRYDRSNRRWSQSRASPLAGRDRRCARAQWRP